MNNKPQAVAWYWESAYIVWPAASLLLFLVTSGPSSADDIVLFFSPFVISAACGFACFKIQKLNPDEGKGMFRLNLTVSIISALAGLSFMALGVAMGRALRGI